MAQKKIELVYSQQSTDFVQGRAYSNPRFFTTPRSGVSQVYIVGDWPNIVEAYEAIGVPVARIDAADVTSNGAKPETVAPPPSMVALPEDERRDVEIPDGWEAMTWPQRRAIASKLSEAPVVNSADAARAIKAELGRRQGPLLTRREIEADLVAMEVDFDPSMPDDHLYALRNEARAIRDA